MQRTTIVAPQQVLQRLRRMAAERGTSMADLIREAHEAKVRTDHPRPRSLGLREPRLATLDRRHFGMLRPRHVQALQLLPEAI